MDAQPTIWERAARHSVAFRATVVLLAGVASAAAFLAGRVTDLSAGTAALVGCAFATVWVLVLVVIDRVEHTRQRRFESMGRVRDFAQRLVIYDRETGFYADWYFRLRLQEELARSRRFNHPCALILAESKRGRLGKEQEAELFKAITRSFRGTDIVAHMGNLRFAVLLTNTPRQGAEIARERLALSVGGGMDVGFACFPEDGDDWRSLVAAAGGPSSDFYAAAAHDWGLLEETQGLTGGPMRTVAGQQVGPESEFETEVGETVA
jgi:GGDEF domain-containing protein